jgi:hypothetical protein
VTPEGGPEWVVSIRAPKTRLDQVLVRYGVGEALWLFGNDIAKSVRFATREAAEAAAVKVRRARVGQSFLVFCFHDLGSWRVALFTPSSGEVEGLDDEGEVTAYPVSSICGTEAMAAEFAALVRECRVGELYEVFVRPFHPPPAPLARPLPWWRRLLLRLGL